MTRKPEPAEAVAARMVKSRARKRDSGLVHVRVWVPADKEQDVRAAIEAAMTAQTKTPPP